MPKLCFLGFIPFASRTNIFFRDKSLGIKSQIISKGNFSVFNSPKNELENVNFCPGIHGQKFFVCFLGELKKPKGSFEIN